MILKTTLGFLLLLAHAEDPNPGPRQSDEAYLLYQQAYEHFSKRDYPRAIQELERLSARYPTYERIDSALLTLTEAYLRNKEHGKAIDSGRELIERKPKPEVKIKAQIYVMDALQTKKEYVKAKSLANEVLADPQVGTKEQAFSYSIRFRSLLEEKQYTEAKNELDRLIQHLENHPDSVIGGFIPDYQMNLKSRLCATSHLLKDKELSEEEVIQYFNQKELCFKEALVHAKSVKNSEILKEWCADFTSLVHEIQKRNIDPFLKQKIEKQLLETRDFAKNINGELTQCYAPYQPKKRPRKRRL